MPKIGTKVDLSKVVQGPPPIVMAVQATSYLKIETPEDLKAWEEDMHNIYGIHSSLRGMSGAASESCSGGGSDDCDLI
jgi:hypothetical protein